MAVPNGTMLMLKSLGIDVEQWKQPLIDAKNAIEAKVSELQATMTSIEIMCGDMSNVLCQIEERLAELEHPSSPDEKLSDEALNERVEMGVVSLQH